MKVLNFGSLNIDYVYSVDHFVKSGETIATNRLETFCGGKGLNQSIALAKAGAQVYHAGKVGREGFMLIQKLQENGVNVSLIQIAESASGHAIIQVNAAGQNCIMLHGGANREIDNQYIDYVFSMFGEGDILLLQNEINGIPEIMKKAHDKKMLIAFNPSPIDRELMNYRLDYVKWFILNEIEGNQLTGQSDPKKIADELRIRYPESAVVLTLGKQGVYYKDQKTTGNHGIYDVQVVDTTAAGDTFTGYFLAGVLEGLEINEILKRASIASSLAVSRKGASTSIPSLEEVSNFEMNNGR